MILQSCSSSLVACNIYITSAASAALPSILSRAQDHCRQLRHLQQQHHDVEKNVDNTAAAAAAVVHAYADIPYDRSSFHLAGRSDCVSEVAASLIQNALNEIEWKSNDDGTAQLTTTTSNNLNKSEARHPFVGLVDHVAIMPISHHDAGTTSTTLHSDAAATAAHEIGDKLQKSNSIKVHYYGHACPQNTPLATIRRKTSFFRSGGANSNDNDGIRDDVESNAVTCDLGECTIGVPNNFVENYNIRLTSNVDFATAKTLTQALRGRNIATKGMGVPGVEALTLPYKRDASRGGDVFEVACNLLEPKTGSVERIEEELKKWIDKQRDDISTGIVDAESEYSRDYFIENAYRVGTTEEQCLNVLKQANNDDDWNKLYDQQVLSRFTEFLK